MKSLMWLSRMTWPMGWVMFASLVAFLPAQAQSSPRVRVGAGLGVDLLVGEASDFLDGGTSRFLMADFRLGQRERWHLRLDAMWGELEKDEDERTGARAENDLVGIMAGPQVTAVVGRLRPYAAALLGVTGVVWSTEVPAANDDVENDFEGGLSWGGHAGLGVTLDEGDHPVVLQVESRIIGSGARDFARAPDPANPSQPVGTIRRDFAALSIRIAVTLGF
jgi:hypothetical protein